jgi:SAM-dependent methyltransferase
MSTITVWGCSVPSDCLDHDEIEYLLALPKQQPDVQWVWLEMDRIWDALYLQNSRTLSDQPIIDFYKNPVWLMNGIFTTLDPVSASHREAIARFIGRSGETKIADYGGGFGELARLIAQSAPDASVSIVEPYPSRFGRERIRGESRIRYVPDLSPGGYGLIVAQDVLEHVEDPIQDAYRIAEAVRPGGKVIFANCFYPFIKCHLPHTFHLRHTFRWVMQSMGLRALGRVEGAMHAQVFERNRSISLARARRAERLSRLLGPMLNCLHPLLSRIKGKVVGR